MFYTITGTLHSIVLLHAVSLLTAYIQGVLYELFYELCYVREV